MRSVTNASTKRNDRYPAATVMTKPEVSMRPDRSADGARRSRARVVFPGREASRQPPRDDDEDRPANEQVDMEERQSARQGPVLHAEDDRRRQKEHTAPGPDRSEARRVGKEWVSKWRDRRW